MLRTLDKNINNLVDTLQKPEVDDRTVVYFGFSEVVASAILANNDFSGKDQTFKITKVSKGVTDVIGELAVLDRVLFEKILRNVLTYNVTKLTTSIDVSDIYTFQSFGDALGYSKYYSEAEIALINEKMDLYKEAMRNTHFGMGQIIEDYL